MYTDETCGRDEIHTESTFTKCPLSAPWCRTRDDITDYVVVIRSLSFSLHHYLFHQGERKPCPETFPNSGQGFAFDEFGVIELDIFFLCQRKVNERREEKNNNDDNYGAVIWSVQPCPQHAGTAESHYLVFPPISTEKNRINPCTALLFPAHQLFLQRKSFGNTHNHCGTPTTALFNRRPKWICRRSENGGAGDRTPIFTAFSWHLRFCRGG